MSEQKCSSCKTNFTETMKTSNENYKTCGRCRNIQFEKRQLKKNQLQNENTLITDLRSLEKKPKCGCCKKYFEPMIKSSNEYYKCCLRCRTYTKNISLKNI